MDDIQDFCPTPVPVEDAISRTRLADGLKAARRPNQFALFKTPKTVEDIL